MSGTLAIAATETVREHPTSLAGNRLRLDHCVSYLCHRVWWPEATYLVNHERRLIYCPVAKAACSSLTHWFLNAAGVPSDRIAPDEHRCAGATISMRANGVRTSLAALRSPEYFSFTFVRNPWSRLVSAYLNKFLRGNTISEKVVQQIARRNKSQTSDITFRQFVAYLASGSPQSFDVHWRPQHLYLKDYRFSLIGRFESLARDFEALHSRLGIDIPLPHCNTTRYAAAKEKCDEIVTDWPLSRLRELAALPGWRQFYTSDVREIVGRIYARDIERFEYRFDK